VVNQDTGKCLDYGTAVPSLYPCRVTDRGQLWTIWSGDAPLRGEGNLPLGGPGYSFRSERIAGASYSQFMTFPLHPQVGDLLDFNTGRLSGWIRERFSIRPLGP
jgi:hypothetical protein